MARKSKDLTDQEKMQIYNEVQSCLLFRREIAEMHDISLWTIRVVVNEIQELINVKIKGIVPKRPTLCPLCGGKVKLNRCDKKKSRSGFVYYCTRCYAWVGTSTRNPLDALGQLAGKEIRKKRRDLHKWFDKLWSNHSERETYYCRLAKALNIDRDSCHFALMSMEQLEQAEKIVKEWWIEKYDI